MYLQKMLRSWFILGVWLGLSWISFGVGCSGTSTGNPDGGNPDQTTTPAPLVVFSELERATIFKLSPLPPIPADPSNQWSDDPKAAHFGQYMYYETRISANQKVSCATCHAPDKGFGDNLAVSKGLQEVTRHAPSIWNTAYNRWFFWDGRVDSLWAQATEPIENDKEMGYTRLELAHFIAQNTNIKTAYENIFGKLPDLSDKIRFPEKGMPGQDTWNKMKEEDQKAISRILANVGKAIAAYERKIISKDAPFDTFVEGWKTGDAEKLKAISEPAQRGLKLFVGKARCVLCHFEANFSNREFHNIGLSLSKTLPRDTGRFDAIDTVKAHPFNGMGEFSDIPKDHANNDKLRYLTQKAHNLGEFKTPSLRSIATHPPYMHDGRFATLQDVIKHYSTFPEEPAFSPREEILLPLKLTDQEISDLVEFLKTLTGKALPESLLKPPSQPMP